jgi:RNA polymerase sigma factor (sigma-70 family)
MTQPDGSDQDQRYSAAARRFGGAIERLARGYEADRELCRDLVQDIHAALWRSFVYFREQCSERSWVYRIAHNTAVSHLIRQRRSRLPGLRGLDDITEIAAPSDVEAELGEARLIEALYAAIHTLAPADRQVMLLYLEDLTAAEIGEITGLSAGAVATRIHRVKALLSGPYREEEDQ